jgi:hypothetical protein
LPIHPWLQQRLDIQAPQGNCALLGPEDAGFPLCSEGEKAVSGLQVFETSRGCTLTRLCTRSQAEHRSCPGLAPSLLLVLLGRLLGIRIIFQVLGFVDPITSSQHSSGLGVKRDLQQKMYIPAVSNHAHSLRFSHAVETSALLEVLLAADTLSVAEARFSKRINISPV